MKATVSFFTKTWGGDYRQFLNGALKRKVDAMDYDFEVVGLVINNEVPLGVADSLSAQADVVIDAEEHAKNVLRFYGLSEEDFNGGYPYSIGELSACWACDTDYLCYVQGDCLVTSGDWVTEGIRVLSRDSSVSVVSPASEVNTWHGVDGRDQFFSDQAFLVRTEEFQNPIFKFDGPEQPEYPDYGGHSFEYKAGQYLRNREKYRKILDQHWVSHPAF